MIEIRNVSKVYSSKNEIKVLDDISLTIDDGLIYGILGLSGAGKTTLLKIISGLEKPTSGDVFVDGKNINDLLGNNLRLFKKSIGVVFQGINLLMMKNVYKNISFPLEIDKVNKDTIKRRVEELTTLVGIESKLKDYPSQLSGGQRQRVAIARSLACNPKVLLLDEVTSALDPITTKQVLSLLKELNEKLKVTIIIITHDVNLAREVCDKIAVIEDGKVKENGKIQDIQNNPISYFGKELFGGKK